MSKTILAQSAKDASNAAILAIANPPKGCPACYAERGKSFPSTHSTRICSTHSAAMWLMSESYKSQHSQITTRP
jgi:hypothetical protein